MSNEKIIGFFVYNCLLSSFFFIHMHSEQSTVSCKPVSFKVVFETYKFIECKNNVTEGYKCKLLT